MGDISTEPSMDEILSSIKRIIAEDGDAAPRARAERFEPEDDCLLYTSDAADE